MSAPTSRNTLRRWHPGCTSSRPVARSAQHVRDHASAAGLPADDVHEIELDLLP
jgi:hypothetical protein